MPLSPLKEMDGLIQEGIDMNYGYILPTLGLILANIIFWYKGNSKELFGNDWTPFRWWLTTSLITIYVTLYAWWKLIEIGDVWKAGVTWGLCSLFTDLILNCIYFGFNMKGVIALLLCAIAGIIVHN